MEVSCIFDIGPFEILADHEIFTFVHYSINFCLAIDYVQNPLNMFQFFAEQFFFFAEILFSSLFFDYHLFLLVFLFMFFCNRVDKLDIEICCEVRGKSGIDVIVEDGLYFCEIQV